MKLKYKTIHLSSLFEGEEATPNNEHIQSMEDELAALDNELEEAELQPVDPSKIMEAEVLGEIGEDGEYEDDVLSQFAEIEGSPEEEKEAELEEELEEHEREEEETELEEDEDPDPESERPETFNLEKVLKDLEGLSNSKVRKSAATFKAQLHEQDIKVAQLEKKLEERDKEFESKQAEWESGQINAPQMSLEDHKPYQELNKEYTQKLTAVHRRLRTSGSKSEIAGSHENLAKHLVKIRTLQEKDGEKGDAAREKFDDKISEVFGGDANRVMDFLEYAADSQEDLSEIRQEFQENLQSHSDNSFREKYDTFSGSARKNLEGYFELSPEEYEKNPLGIRAFGQRLMKGTNGDAYRRHIKNDIASVIELVGGVAPFNPEDPSYKGMDPEKAKQSWLNRKRTVDSKRESLSAELIFEAIQMRRIFPGIVKQANSGKRTKSPSPGTTRAKGSSVPQKAPPKKKKGQSITEQMDEELAELDKEIEKNPILG